jgi:hypothetical protein
MDRCQFPASENDSAQAIFGFIFQMGIQANLCGIPNGLQDFTEPGGNLSMM